jgi:monoamine oxidase
LTGFIGLPFAESTLLEAEQREERRKAVVTTFARYFGEQAMHLSDSLECDWADEPYIAGCVPYLSPGVLTECGSALSTPIERIHWAGAETSAIWEGHMEGAVRSAERVVEEILAGRKQDIL